MRSKILKDRVVVNREWQRVSKEVGISSKFSLVKLYTEYILTSTTHYNN